MYVQPSTNVTHELIGTSETHTGGEVIGLEGQSPRVVVEQIVWSLFTILGISGCVMQSTS
jgi:hypothetical protein